jgi:hypothetical protein
MSARRAEMAAIAQDLVGADLRLRPGPGTRERVAAFVAAESRCCPFLALELRDEPDALVLAVAGSPGSELVVRELVSALSAG